MWAEEGSFWSLLCGPLSRSRWATTVGSASRMTARCGPDVDAPEIVGVNSIQLLHHQGRRNVPVCDDDFARAHVRKHFARQVVVAVGGVQAGEGDSVHRLGEFAGQPADRSFRWFGGDVDYPSLIPE